MLLVTKTKVILKEDLIMATKTKRSGFDVPTYGTRHPKGTQVKKNSDGTVTVVEPKKKTGKK